MIYFKCTVHPAPNYRLGINQADYLVLLPFFNQHQNIIQINVEGYQPIEFNGWLTLINHQQLTNPNINNWIIDNNIQNGTEIWCSIEDTTIYINQNPE